MPAVEISPEAREDMLDIWCHIASQNPIAADRQILRLEAAVVRCAKFPGLGRPRPELREKIRVLPVDSYLLIYLPMPNGILISRILHAARDIDTEFSE
ncbi:MAG: type II toxin-antitoxin system RelE/ParE family toxin [Niveispirillum sp.]|uniref:type II toxin-antitoxin system RelE/ParE family toxin n=1 Tax=Niveispirillum sp. TaxID=1917217 RepID=UPI003BA67605